MDKGDWLSSATNWCLFLLNWKCLLPHDKLQYIIPYMCSLYYTGPREDLEFNLQTSFPKYCCSNVLYDLNFTSYSCPWRLACQSPKLPVVRRNKRKALRGRIWISSFTKHTRKRSYCPRAALIYCICRERPKVHELPVCKPSNCSGAGS